MKVQHHFISCGLALLLLALGSLSCSKSTSSAFESNAETTDEAINPTTDAESLSDFSFDGSEPGLGAGPGETVARQGVACLSDSACESGQTCNEGRCIADCGSAAEVCGETLLECCAEGASACVGGSCTPLAAPCEFSEECELDEYCEPLLGSCVSAEERDSCEFRPPVGEFSPAMGCVWTAEPDGPFPAASDVVMTPSVGNLTDDNADGVTDTKDMPDVAFVSFDYATGGCCTDNGVLRIASGDCTSGQLQTIFSVGDGIDIPCIGGASNPACTAAGVWTGRIGNSTGLVIANLDFDENTAERAPELVATQKNGDTLAFKRITDDGTQWALLWEQSNYLTGTHKYNGGIQPSVADMDGDGLPEVIVGNVVLNGQDGSLIWDGLVSSGASDPGIGNNAFLGPVSTVADLDLDGSPEVIAGNTVYNADGTERWSYTYTTRNSNCNGSESAPFKCDGFSGVGNFDADPEGEVVIIRLGEVFVLDTDGTLLHTAQVPYYQNSSNPLLYDVTDRKNEAGPPTIADFDGDGRPEIGTAGASYYVVFDFDADFDAPEDCPTVAPLPDPGGAYCNGEGASDPRCNTGCSANDRQPHCDPARHIRWATRNDDASSRSTASSVFDFEGDGASEVVYADESAFVILDGTSGIVLACDDSHTSNTRVEMPVVVDMDNDGKSEVIIPEAANNSSIGGLHIWTDTDNNWVRTRRIWNQHTYHVTNISEDGQVPRVEVPNWSLGRLNNFRQNVQPDGLFDAPDFRITSVEAIACLENNGIRLAANVANDGALGVPAGIAVSFLVQQDGGGFGYVGTAFTESLMLPGQSTRVGFDWSAGGSLSGDEFEVRAIADSDENGDAAYNECEEGNNALDAGPYPKCTSIGLI